MGRNFDDYSDFQQKARGVQTYETHYIKYHLSSFGHNLAITAVKFYIQVTYFFDIFQKEVVHYRAVRKSENPVVPVIFDGHNLPPLVEIGLTDLPKSGGAMAPPAPPCIVAQTVYLSDCIWGSFSILRSKKSLKQPLATTL